MILSQDDIQLLRICVELANPNIREWDFIRLSKHVYPEDKRETLLKKLSLIQQPIYLDEK